MYGMTFLGEIATTTLPSLTIDGHLFGPAAGAAILAGFLLIGPAGDLLAAWIDRRSD